MASVWLARIEGKHGFEKLVAVKMILPKFAAEVRFEQMFLDEARIASRIEHMNVAQIFDLGEHHEVLYLVLEYIDGDSLSRLNRAVRKKGLKIPHGILLRILADIAGGLHAAHELCGTDGRPLGVVHRDVSPQNILVDTRGVAKLIDFGIAKARDRLAGETNAGTLKGKIRYMAPEQALGRKLDRRADVWAIGAILYHLLSGKPAFEGENELATLNLLTAGLPPAPLPESVHPAVRAVVARALAHAAPDRYATAAELQSALETAAIEARIVTSTPTVAAYANEHLAARIEKRRQAMELALGAASERGRMRQLLKPSADASTGISNVMAKVAAVDITMPDAPGALVRSPLERMTPMEPHSATLTSSTLESSIRLPVGMVPRRSWLFAAAASLALISFIVLLSHRPKAHPGAPAAATDASSLASSLVTVAPPPPASVRPPPSAIPVIAATDLPRVGEIASAPRPAPPRAPAARPPTPPPAPSPTSHVRHRVDDGF